MGGYGSGGGDCTLGLLGTIKLRRRGSGLPTRLSKKRRRHTTVTITLTGGPSVLLTSRPAKTISAEATSAVCRLFRGLGGRLNVAVVVIARSVTLTNHMSHAILVSSKGMDARGLGGRPTVRCAMLSGTREVGLASRVLRTTKVRSGGIEISIRSKELIVSQVWSVLGI